MKLDELTRLCLFVDVEGYGRRSTTEQSRVQGWLVEIIERVREEVGLSKKELTKQDQGDGALLLVHPHVPIPRILPRLVSSLVDAVDWVNEPLREGSRIKLRAALDAGVVRQAANGYVGRAIVSAARIVNSRALRTALREPSSPAVALAISDILYQDVVMGGLPGLPADHFQEIPVQEKEYAGWAWLLVPTGHSPFMPSQRLQHEPRHKTDEDEVH